MKINPQRLYDSMSKVGVGFFVGVPDSLLKEFCRYIDDSVPPDRHIIAVNEGSAIAIATGFQLATNTLPLVYLQNSGLGNTINPLLSLADPEVYGIPMILMVGWRGQPGKPNFTDEPQHVKQGRVSPALLEAMEIPFKILSTELDDSDQTVNWAVNKANEINGPVAILVQKNTFHKYEPKKIKPSENKNLLCREEVIEFIINNIPPDSFIVSSTGMISRELYECRERNNQGHSRDFLTVGSMGHSSQIALGIALSKPDHQIICLDGDGAALMHMGGLASIGVSKTLKYNHILLNNGVHDSVGGQSTLGQDIDFIKIAEGCGYNKVKGPVQCLNGLKTAIDELSLAMGPSFLEIYIRPGARFDLGRPKESPKENKELFIQKLSK